jgi:hypothetical protein
MAISTSNLQDLSDVPTLKRLLQSIAMLDAILQPEWQYRYAPLKPTVHGEWTIMNAISRQRPSRLYASMSPY